MSSVLNTFEIPVLVEAASREQRVFAFCCIGLWCTSNARYSQHATDNYNPKAQIQSVFGVSLDAARAKVYPRRLQSHFSRVDFSFFSQVGKDRKG
jgi:hypothetical protein